MQTSALIYLVVCKTEQGELIRLQLVSSASIWWLNALKYCSKGVIDKDMSTDMV